MAGSMRTFVTDRQTDRRSWLQRTRGGSKKLKANDIYGEWGEESFVQLDVILCCVNGFRISIVCDGCSARWMIYEASRSSQMRLGEGNGRMLGGEGRNVPRHRATTPEPQIVLRDCVKRIFLAWMREIGTAASQFQCVKSRKGFQVKYLSDTMVRGGHPP